MYRLKYIMLQLFFWKLLNQARAGLRSARAWFFIIDLVRIVGMRVCVCVCVCVCVRVCVRARGY